MLQFRPRGTAEVAYSPHRDLAYVFTNLVSIALNGMGETDWEPWYGDYLKHCEMTEEDLGEVATALAKGFGNFCDSEIQTPGEALEKAGFFDCANPAILAVCAKIGQVCIGAYFTSLRDSLRSDEEKPAKIKDLEDMAAAFQQAMNDKCHKECES